MNTMHYDGGFWPTQQQELLLRAALLQGDAAIDAWHEWKSNVDIDRLDLGSHRLLPLLYWNLLILWFQHSRSLGGIKLPYKLLEFPRYLQHVWGMDHLSWIPFYAVYKGVRRIWNDGLI